MAVVIRRRSNLRVRDHRQLPVECLWRPVVLTVDDMIPGGVEKRLQVEAAMGADERVYLKRPNPLPHKVELEMLFGETVCISLDPKECTKVELSDTPELNYLSSDTTVPSP